MQLDKAIETAEKEYSSADLPMEPTKAQLLLREHESTRSKIKHLVDFTSEEGEEIAVRVRQQVRGVHAALYGSLFFREYIDNGSGSCAVRHRNYTA